ncbi:FAS1-like dehydratase domain-containing protein [Oryzicola mucosus]|uniref:MaoC family dehydratase N-terminal domain-containing protein n=1 Tax=Oryzicola mucosus TaxID=2767425 RepID=A0A8J6TZW1_9HYPH|nr:MaoC family dehydratase N-terminal domain-containing protein [Oryzicola mucosus]MBD0416754.1 MaoC family dehydratase N-terminal domain-containing protein [Oryzicola mucosus]
MDSVAERYAEEQRSRYRGAVTERVEAGRVRDYLLALESDLTDPSEPVPPLFLLSLGRNRRPHLNRLPGGTVNASDEFEFFGDVFIGEDITVKTELRSVEKKAGSSRDLYLITAEKLYHNAAGELVARRINSILRWD